MTVGAVPWAALWADHWIWLLGWGVVLLGGVYVQLENLAHPRTARRVLGSRAASLLLGDQRPSEKDARLFAAGRRVQRDWRAWLALFVPSFVVSAGAFLCLEWCDTVQGQGHPRLELAAAALFYGCTWVAAGPIQRAFLTAELARPGH